MTVAMRVETNLPGTTAVNATCVDNKYLTIMKIVKNIKKLISNRMYILHFLVGIVKKMYQFAIYKVHVLRVEFCKHVW